MICLNKYYLNGGKTKGIFKTPKGGFNFRILGIFVLFGANLGAY